MNIELIKQLEDEEQKLRDLNLQLNNLIAVKKAQYIHTVRDDFSLFFQRKRVRNHF